MRVMRRLLATCLFAKIFVPRRFAWANCSVICFQEIQRASGCSHSCCCTILAATHASTPTASWSHSRSKTNLWDRDEIEKGLELIETALQLQNIGPYQLQAAIAALHAHA